jgi:hypothetical protein
VAFTTTLIIRAGMQRSHHSRWVFNKIHNRKLWLLKPEMIKKIGGKGACLGLAGYGKIQDTADA